MAKTNSTAEQTAEQNNKLISKFFNAEAKRISSKEAAWSGVFLGKGKKGIGWGLRGPSKASADFYFNENILTVSGRNQKGDEAPTFHVDVGDGELANVKGALDAVTRP
jgi:hypothetical protein